MTDDITEEEMDKKVWEFIVDAIKTVDVVSVEKSTAWNSGEFFGTTFVVTRPKSFDTTLSTELGANYGIKHLTARPEGRATFSLTIETNVMLSKSWDNVLEHAAIIGRQFPVLEPWAKKAAYLGYATYLNTVRIPALERQRFALTRLLESIP